MYKKKSRIFSAFFSSFMDTMQSNYKHIAAVLLHLSTFFLLLFRTNIFKGYYYKSLYQSRS